MLLKDERGMMAIGVALMLIVVLSLFGGALWQYSMFELKRVERTEEDLQALFLARAGAEAVMGAWKKRKAEKVPEQDDYVAPVGHVDTLYFDLDSERDPFTTVKPANYLGTVDVVVTQERVSEEEGQDEVVTVIEATAKVGSTTRTVKLVTYPHRYGHDDPPKWYEESTGYIRYYRENETSEPVTFRLQEPVILRAKDGTSISFDGSILKEMGWRDRSFAFSAPILVFESPLRLVRSAGVVEDSPLGSFDLVLEAEKVYLNDLEVAFLPQGNLPLNLNLQVPKDFSIVLALPLDSDPMAGLSPSQVSEKVGYDVRQGVDEDERYGEVYFGGHVYWRNYEWYRHRLVWAKVRAREGDNPVALKQLDGQAFFFKNGWRLIPEGIHDLRDPAAFNVQEYITESINQGWLIPIPEEHRTGLETIESLRPFFWEQ
jgi:hypothetical protein